MAFTRKVWLRSIIYLSFFICLFVNFVNSEDVPYTLHNSPSKLDTVIVLDRYKRDVNDNSSSSSSSTSSASENSSSIAPGNSQTTAAPPVPSATTVQNAGTTQSTSSQNITTGSQVNPTTADQTTKNSVVTTKSTGTTQTPKITTTPSFTEIKDSGHHKYYNSTVYGGIDQWVELWDASNNQQLSGSHRLAVSVTTKFKFLFYGHEVNKITIATGGFLYMSPFLHQWLTATQYIAPLMANFDTTLGNSSEILYKDFGQKFVVEWRNVFLQDQNHTHPFTFQVILHTNGTIVFCYQEVPLDVMKIEKKNHPVKIGLSDAFYIDSVVGGKQRRTIYEYHRVEMNFTLVQGGVTVVLVPLNTCNRAHDCETCLTQEDSFDCKWCSKLQRCSDGVDWQRQEWRDQNCEVLLTPDTNFCNVTFTLPPTSTTARVTAPPCVDGKGDCSAQQKKKSSNQSVAAVIVIIVLLLIIICAIGGWFYYAYTHPTSASGMWLMEHRPSQMKQKVAKMKFWKRSTPSGEKYAVETEA